MLAALGRHPNRPAHIHFIVTAPGYKPVITHIFTSDSEYLAEDAVFGVKETLIVNPTKLPIPNRRLTSTLLHPTGTLRGTLPLQGTPMHLDAS